LQINDAAKLFFPAFSVSTLFIAWCVSDITNSSFDLMEKSMSCLFQSYTAKGIFLR